MRRLRVGDEVIVISGSDKGRRGRVMRLLERERLMVAGVRMVKRHTKPDPSRNRPGGIIEKEAPIHISNVALYNSQAERADRVRFQFAENGEKQRVFVSDGRSVVEP